MKSENLCFQNMYSKVGKFNRSTYAVNVNVSAAGVGKMGAMYEVYSMMGNEFRLILPRIKYDDFCAYLRDRCEFYDDLRAHSNFPKRSNKMCPIVKGDYAVINYPIDFSRIRGIPFNPKKLRLNLFLYCDEVEDGLLQMDLVDH